MSEAAQNLSDFMATVDIRPDGAFAGSPAPSGVPTPRQVFSIFDPANSATATSLILGLHKAFDAAADPEAGLVAAGEAARKFAQKFGLEATQHAMRIFAAHLGKTREGLPRIAIPPMAFLADSAPVAAGLTPAAPATSLHWFREDLFLNEHHQHWHIVYNTQGTFHPPSQTFRTKSRQGEVFVYMHQQMLARYDTERVAVGLEKVEPLTDFTAPIDEGYDPNARPPANIGYVERGDNELFSTFGANMLEARRQVFRDMIATGTLNGNPITLNPDLLGTLLEANHAIFGPTTATTIEELQQEFGARWQALEQAGLNLHNTGHGVITAVPTPGGIRVMSNPHTSLQDPVFWRWHRMIDDLAEELAATQPPHVPDPDEPTVLRDEDDSPDVLILAETLLRAEGIDLDADDRNTAIAGLVDERFGSAVWDTPIESALVSVELRTGTISNQYIYLRVALDPADPPVSLDFSREHLISERFATIVRADNTADTARDATVRVFLCAEALLIGSAPDQEHRFWIELERRSVTLQPGKNVITLWSDESTIVRKLGGRAPFPHSAFTPEDFGDLHSGQNATDDYCDCGWPLNLLLPKGTLDGMAFRLMAMVSDGAPSHMNGECGSRAFCGAGFDPYPELDGLNLGYPFDRPAPGGTLALIEASPNMASRRITIRHDQGLAGEFGLIVTN